MRHWALLALAGGFVLGGCSDKGELLRSDLRNVPRLTYSPSPLKLAAQVGDSTEAILTVENTGRVLLSIDTMTVSSPEFSVLDWPRSLPPGERGTVTVRYRASQPSATGTLTIRSNAIPGVTEVTLIGALPGGNLVTFADVKPIFLQNCAVSGCHDAITIQNGLDLTDYASASAPTRVTPGSPMQSLLYDYVNRGYMPFGRTRLPDDKIALIFRWIADGARQ